MAYLNDAFSITDLKYKTKDVLKLTKEMRIYFLRKSKIEAALVDINYLKALQETYEESLDIIKKEFIEINPLPQSIHHHKTKTKIFKP